MEGHIMKRKELRTVKVFVYGTLKTGYGNRAVVKDKIIDSRPAAILGFDIFHLGGFPGIKPVTNGNHGQVFGEVLTLTEPSRAVRSLDGLEGYNEDREESSLYLRRKVAAIDLGNGRKEDVFVYVFNRPIHEHCLHIKSGNWNRESINAAYRDQEGE